MKQKILKLASHEYRIPVYSITDEGLEQTDTLNLFLVKGSKLGEGIEKQDGIIIENLLEVCTEYLSSVNVGEMKTKETSCAITKIEEALMWIQKRTGDRIKRKVIDTYEK